MKLTLLAAVLLAPVSALTLTAAPTPTGDDAELAKMEKMV